MQRLGLLEKHLNILRLMKKFKLVTPYLLQLNYSGQGNTEFVPSALQEKYFGARCDQPCAGTERESENRARDRGLRIPPSIPLFTPIPEEQTLSLVNVSKLE